MLFGASRANDFDVGFFPVIVILVTCDHPVLLKLVGDFLAHDDLLDWIAVLKIYVSNEKAFHVFNFDEFIYTSKSL